MSIRGEFLVVPALPLRSRGNLASGPLPSSAAPLSGHDPWTTDPVTRIVEALERLAPPPPAPPRLGGGRCLRLAPAARRRACPPCRAVSRVEIGLLQGIDRQKDLLVENTLRFARGLPANNAMLWGARGMGKSSLVKAAHAAANAERPAASR